MPFAPMQHSFSVARGAMSGHIGRFVWINGSDTHPDQYMNTLLTRGYCRFGNVFFLPSRPNPVLLHMLGLH